MPGESFRFIHASDFHLERPLGDLDELPSHLHDAIASAPWKAAAAVFEAALVENVDFLILAGDLLNPVTAGPRGISFLVDYFDQLNEREIPVYWAAGTVDDPQKWPEAMPLPPNVTVFPRGRTETVAVQRGGSTICQLVGRSSEGRSTLHVPSYRIDPSDEFTIAVGFGTADADALAEGRFDYWALGGTHQRHAYKEGAQLGPYHCGSPQGRLLEEAGPHGYYMVDVDADGTGRVHEIEADRFRYCRVEIDAADIAMTGSVRSLLGERVGRLLHENGDRHLLIGWDLSLSSGEALQAVGDPNELLKWLRREYGHGKPSAWTLRLVVRPPRTYPKSWHDEDTILGDFLRAVDNHRKTAARDLNLHPMTEEHSGLPSTSESLLAEPTAGDRVDLLDQAALLGVELLRGGKVKLTES